MNFQFFDMYNERFLFYINVLTVTLTNVLLQSQIFYIMCEAYFYIKYALNTFLITWVLFKLFTYGHLLRLDNFNRIFSNLLFLILFFFRMILRNKNSTTCSDFWSSLNWSHLIGINLWRPRLQMNAKISFRSF